jgi:hypothetical protein
VSRPKAAPVFTAERGDFWRAQCPVCPWVARHRGGLLPFPTREQAEHATDLHAVLCRGAR